MYCYTISSFYSLLPASYICRSTLQPVSLSQSSKRITAATFRECFTVNRIVFYVVRENLIHVVNFGVHHKIYKIFTLKILNIHPIWGSNPGPLDQKSNALSSALMGLGFDASTWCIRHLLQELRWFGEQCLSNAKCHDLAERSFDLRTSGLWAQHASTAPLCFTHGIPLSIRFLYASFFSPSRKWKKINDVISTFLMMH